MPVKPKPLFRADVLRPRVGRFDLPDRVAAFRPKLENWAALFTSGRADDVKESELLGKFVNEFFGELLGYVHRVDGGERYTLSQEAHVQVAGDFADAVLGRFGGAAPEYVVVVEGKGPKDPLDRPYAGRKWSAVDQAYDYAQNLPCDWIIVTSTRETRLYWRGADKFTFETFDTVRLAEDDRHLAKFVYLLGAKRVVPEGGGCHLDVLSAASEKAGRELTKEFYVRYAEMRQDAFDHLVRENPDVPRSDVLSATQKLLDRVLFVSFCEDRGLLPPHSIKQAYEYKPLYEDRPVWANFRGLFKAVNEGNKSRGIHGYNGGLFETDALLDERLVVPDAVCTALHELSEYEYREPGHELDDPDDDEAAKPIIDVDILGHIFEQSITDLERLRNELEGRVEPVGREKHRTRRKKEGAFYTPAFVTRYIVEQALGRTLAERFEALREQQQTAAREKAPTGSGTKSLDDPREYELGSLNRPQRNALIAFWEAWEQELTTVRVLDPACGSGAFLIETFDQLHAAYEEANERLRELAKRGALPFNVDRQILQGNLYGVDLNTEAIEICRLSLWIKTAANDEKLTSLDDTIRVGNSVVDDPEADPRALDWRAAFPEVFADDDDPGGGFDVVVGNPPYVRQEWISEFKPYFEANYASYHGMADLYVYFYELGLRLLRPGGRLSYIVTNKWMKAGYGEPLRRFFAERSWMESVVDFGHAKQIFEQADVFPSILVARKPSKEPEPETTRVCAIPREQLRIDDLSEQIQSEGFALPSRSLTALPWRLERPEVTELMRRLRNSGPNLSEFSGSDVQYGVKTGRNEVFLIDDEMRNRLVDECETSADVIKPYLRGQDIKRWAAEWDRRWMIFTRRGIDIASYPAVLNYLEAHRDRLEPKPDGWTGDRWVGRKGGAYEWYELQDPVEYWESFEADKICLQRLAYHSRVSYDTQRMYVNDAAIVIPNPDPWLICVLNSPAMWYYAFRVLPHKKDEALALDIRDVKKLPIPEPRDGTRADAVESFRQLHETTQELGETRRTLLDWLRVQHDIEKPSKRLQAAFDLDSDSFVKEVQKVRGKRNPLSAAGVKSLRDEHEATIVPAQRRLREADDLEHELADLVHAAYGLTDEEIDLMWRTAPPRMPIARW